MRLAELHLARNQQINSLTEILKYQLSRQPDSELSALLNYIFFPQPFRPDYAYLKLF